MPYYKFFRIDGQPLKVVEFDPKGKEASQCRHCSAIDPKYFDENFEQWLCENCWNVPRCGACEAVKHVLTKTIDLTTWYCPWCEPGELYARDKFEKSLDEVSLFPRLRLEFDHGASIEFDTSISEMSFPRSMSDSDHVVSVGFTAQDGSKRTVVDLVYGDDDSTMSG